MIKGRKWLVVPISLVACVLVLTISGNRETGAPPAQPAAYDSGKEDTHAHIERAGVAEFAGLLDDLLKMRDSAEQRGLVADLLGRWLAADPQAFAAYLDAVEIEGDAIWNQLSPAFFAAVADLERAEASTFEMRDLMVRVISLTAVTDPQRALGWAREWLDGAHLDVALAAIAGEWVGVDPDGAMALVGEIKSLANRLDAAVSVGTAVGGSDPERGLAWAESLVTEIDRSFAQSGVLTGLAGRDSMWASEEFSQIVAELKSSYQQRVIAERTASGGTTEEEYEGLSPEEILKAELARPNPNLIYLEKTAYFIGTAMARQDPGVALKWARSLDLYQGNGAAMEGIYQEWVVRSPEEAYSSFLEQPARYPELAGKLFEAWATEDFTAAATAAVQLVSGPERAKALQGVAQGWLDAGAPAAEVAAWSDGLASMQERDSVRAVVAAGVSFDDPQLAWRQIDQIGNPTTRANLFQDVFPNLVTRDPNLARQALAQLKLSHVETEYYQSMLGD